MSTSKISAKKEDVISRSEPFYPMFSFRYMVDGKYSFDYFKKDARGKVAAYDGFIKKLRDVSDTSMIRLAQLDKKAGFETIPLERFNDQFMNKINGAEIGGRISKDSKLTVMRFKGRKDYRIICKQDSVKGNIFYVIGFDFDYSAYEH